MATDMIWGTQFERNLYVRKLYVNWRCNKILVLFVKYGIKTVFIFVFMVCRSMVCVPGPVRGSMW